MEYSLRLSRGSIRFRFDVKKVAQATAYLLKSMREERHNFMALLKMLYIVDRKSLKESGFPITGDTYVAMKHGPVLSRTKGIRFSDAQESPFRISIHSFRIFPRARSIVGHVYLANAFDTVSRNRMRWAS